MTSKDPIHLENREKVGIRLFSPTAARNKAPIGDIISDHIPKNAKILEIASGTGEHGAYMCGLRPDIIWQPSDPNAESRDSQNDWARDCEGRMLTSGAETAESNLQFDISLKSRNSSWGVRNLDAVKHIFSEAGFTHKARIVMPKENRTVIFTKTR